MITRAPVYYSAGARVMRHTVGLREVALLNNGRTLMGAGYQGTISKRGLGSFTFTKSALRGD